MRLNRYLVPIVAIISLTLTPFVALCQSGGSNSNQFVLSSTKFSNEGAIPPKYSCDGDDVSPPLAWSGQPAQTKSFALILRDPDAPRGSFVHWVLYNLPPTVTSLPTGVPATATLAEGGVQGVNGAGAIGYHGVCPPPGPAHHYHFHLIALDSMLDLKPGADAATVESAAAAHTLASTKLVGTFGH
jgi:Raf kinase inhibitor-like YbhB/YbcL family protein